MGEYGQNQFSPFLKVESVSTWLWSNEPMRDGVSLSTQNEGTGSSLLDIVVLRLEAARACSMLESNLFRHKTREAPVTSSSSASSLAECVSLLAERKAAPSAIEGGAGGSSPTFFGAYR